MNPEILQHADPIKRAQLFFVELREAIGGPPISDPVLASQFKLDLDRILIDLADTPVGESGLIKKGDYESISRAVFIDEDASVHSTNESRLSFSILHSSTGFTLPDTSFIFRWMLEVRVEDQLWTKLFQDMNGMMGDNNPETGELSYLEEQARGLTAMGNTGSMVLHPSLLTIKI